MSVIVEEYKKYRSQLPEDTLILFRLGDFYEMFNEDAKIAAPLLHSPLCKRYDFFMTGIYVKKLDDYLPILFAAGYKVAIVETKETKKSSVPVRALTKILAPQNNS